MENSYLFLLYLSSSYSPIQLRIFGSRIRLSKPSTMASRLHNIIWIIRCPKFDTSHFHYTNPENPRWVGYTLFQKIIWTILTFSGRSRRVQYAYIGYLSRWVEESQTRDHSSWSFWLVLNNSDILFVI